jgi:hypothetical protein
MTNLKLSCGHEIDPAVASKYVTRCPTCIAADDRAYLANPQVRFFTAMLSADGRVITNGVGGILGEVEDLLDGVYCFVRTGDGRRWRASGAWADGFASFKLVGD